MHALAPQENHQEVKDVIEEIIRADLAQSGKSKDEVDCMIRKIQDNIAELAKVTLNVDPEINQFLSDPEHMADVKILILAAAREYIHAAEVGDEIDGLLEKLATERNPVAIFRINMRLREISNELQNDLDAHYFKHR